MYGLIEYSYDYYTFKELICVSDKKIKLVKLAIEINKDLPVVDLDENREEHVRLSKNETTHFGICEIKVI